MANPLPVGTEVQLSGLSAAVLNGAVGEVVAALGADGRYGVKLWAPKAALKAYPEPVRIKAASVGPRVFEQNENVSARQTSSSDNVAPRAKEHDVKEGVRQPSASPGGPPQAAASPQAWPWAVPGKAGLPPLYPGPPGWLRDKSTREAYLSNFPPVYGMMISNYLQQRMSDERWGLLMATYEALPGGAKAARPMEEHQQHFRASGFTLQGEASGSVQLTFRQIMSGGVPFQVDAAFVPPAELPPRKCDHCKKVTAGAECACGEAFCSRACQEKDWRNHRRQCDAVHDNNQLGVMLTHLWWASQGIGRAGAWPPRT